MSLILAKCSSVSRVRRNQPKASLSHSIPAISGLTIHCLCIPVGSDLFHFTDTLATRSQQRAQRVRNPLDLLYPPTFRNLSEMQYRPIRRADQSRLIINRSSSILESSIEELAQRFVGREVFGLDLGEIAPEDGRVELETKGTEPDGEDETIKVSPELGQ
jgi:hypothetical protein